MAYLGDWMKSLQSLQPPTNYPTPLTNKYFKGAQQGYDKAMQNYQKQLSGIESKVLGALEGPEGLPESYQRIGSEPRDTFLNALIGKNTLQPNATLPSNPMSQSNLPFGMGPGSMPGKQNYLLAGQPSPDVSEAFGSGWVPSGGEEATKAMDWSKVFNPQTLALIGAEPLGRLAGGRYGGKLAGAAANVGVAAAQGGANPVSDIMALYSLLRLIPGF